MPGQLDMALHALQLLLEPTRLMILVLGVLIGLAIGCMPGLGGVVALAVLRPVAGSRSAVWNTVRLDSGR